MTSRGPLTSRLLILSDPPDEELARAVEWHLNKALLGELGETRREYGDNQQPENDYSCLLEVRTALTLGADSLERITGITAHAFFHKKSGGLSRLVGSVWSREEVVAIRAACRSESESVAESVLPPRLHSVVAAICPSSALRGSLHLMPTVYQMIKRARDLSMEESF